MSQQPLDASSETGQLFLDGLCPMCKGSGKLVRPMPLGGFKSLSDALVSCPVCSTERRGAWIAEHCGLSEGELDTRLSDFKIIRFRTPKDADRQVRDEIERRPAQRAHAREMVKAAVHDGHGLYTFYGDFGSGKTLALQVILNECREVQTWEGYYATFASILDHLRGMYAQNQDTTNFWERLLRIKVLCVDEITRFNEESRWVQDRLFVLTDERYRRRDRTLTVFGTNADVTQVLPPDESIGYLFSRMREGKLVELRGDVRAAIGGS